MPEHYACLCPQGCECEKRASLEGGPFSHAYSKFEDPEPIQVAARSFGAWEPEALVQAWNDLVSTKLLVDNLDPHRRPGLSDARQYVTIRALFRCQAIRLAHGDFPLNELHHAIATVSNGAGVGHR